MKIYQVWLSLAEYDLKHGLGFFLNRSTAIQYASKELGLTVETIEQMNQEYRNDDLSSANHKMISFARNGYFGGDPFYLCVAEYEVNED